MNESELAAYNTVKSGRRGYFELDRGLIAVWGKESVQFLNGMITNDVAKLDDGGEMLAAFPNAKGRLLAVVRVRREGERFLFETEAATSRAVYDNLFRFTYAGDFFVEDLSENYRYFEIFGELPAIEGGIAFATGRSNGVFCPDPQKAREILAADGVELTEDVYETLRVESGIPKFGVDMTDATIVPEIGIDGLISYNKGCYIGQEIIARIHFRGHVAKQLTRVIFDVDAAVSAGTELTAADGKPAGTVTSAVFSPSLGKVTTLAFVRYDYLVNGTEVMAENAAGIVTPF